MKEKLLSLIVGVAFMSPAWADVEIVTDRAVVGQNDVLEARLRFPAPDSGDLYVAAMIQGQLRFYGEDGKFHVEPVPYRRDGVYDKDEVIFKFPGAAVPQGRYILYSVVTDAGADVFDFQRWHGPVARQLFIANEPPQQSGDSDGDGWPDDDQNHDGFSDMDKNFDGWRDDDENHNGIPDMEEGNDTSAGHDHGGAGHDHGGADHDQGGTTGGQGGTTGGQGGTTGGQGGTTGGQGGTTGGQGNGAELAQGQALYAQHCAGCHGQDPAGGANKIRRGADPARIRWAINNNRGGMGFLNNVLTDADIQAISAYIASR